VGPGTDLRELVATEFIDIDLAALVLVLVERGVPLIVAGVEQDVAEKLRRAFAARVFAEQPTRDALAGGVVIGASLEDVLHRLGASADAHHDHDVPDEVRDVGIVLVVRDGRVSVAHYVRPIERDAAGHLQRRPPAVLAAWNDEAARMDSFHWAVTDELAARAGITREQLENDRDSRARALSMTTTAADTPRSRAQ
jgi:hypothetical protein